MSLLVRSMSRLASNVPKRALSVSSSLKADQMMPDPVEHATGRKYFPKIFRHKYFLASQILFIVANIFLINSLISGLEKYELLAKQAGNNDPFFLKAVQRAKGTRDEPTIVHAMDNYRMVGCVCNEEDTNIKWTWLSEVSNNVFFMFNVNDNCCRDTPRDVSADTGWS